MALIGRGPEPEEQHCSVRRKDTTRPIVALSWTRKHRGKGRALLNSIRIRRRVYSAATRSPPELVHHQLVDYYCLARLSCAGNCRAPMSLARLIF